MTRSIVIVLLIVAHLILGTGSTLIYLNYQLNTAAYEVNCVNKDKPQLRCKGKCQMAKQMEENNSDSKASKLNVYTLEYTIPETPGFSTGTTAYFIKEKTKRIVHPHNLIASKLIKKIGKPPDVFV